MSNKTSRKKHKIKAIGIKYNFSIFDKNEIYTVIKQLNEQIAHLDTYHEKFMEIKYDLSVINTYYSQRLPIELARIYLDLPKKSPFTDNEIIYIASVKHQKELLSNSKDTIQIKHIIDGLEYPCQIVYNSSKCVCGVDDYIWSSPNDMEYKKSYWLQDSYKPMIKIKNEPLLSLFDEYNIIQKYVSDNSIHFDTSPNLKWISNRNISRRANIYPIYYLKYWEWEHLDNENKPVTENDWREYFATSGCANHRDLIETVHMLHIDSLIEGNKNLTKDNIDYRYGVFLTDTTPRNRKV